MWTPLHPWGPINKGISHSEKDNTYTLGPYARYCKLLRCTLRAIGSALTRGLLPGTSL
ncbi:hypothetical protein LINPERHAP1_LOCUS43338 [Linum perenne]